MNAVVFWIRAYGGALAQLWREPLASLFNLLALACAFGLGLAAVVWLGDASLGRSVPGAGRFAPEVTLVLRGGTGEAARNALERAVRADAGVERVRFVSREAALERLSRDLGEPHLLEGLGGNPLPDALVVTLAADLPAARTDQLLKRWRARGDVDEVLADREMVERMRHVSGTLRLMAQGVVVLLLTSGAVVVFNTIRLQLAGRQQEIELIRLLGASAAFVRRPFVARGTLLALLGAGLGWGLAELLLQRVAGWVGPLATVWGIDTPPASVPPQTGLAVLGIALLLGWITAWLGVRQHLATTDRR
ncbi:MAG: FtsX-like permease family protein [Rhodocyclaceae bacterium]|nr:FtsX-like permease family protein [Rhodocyclaceae bacterium]